MERKVTWQKEMRTLTFIQIHGTGQEIHKTNKHAYIHCILVLQNLGHILKCKYIYIYIKCRTTSE